MASHKILVPYNFTRNDQKTLGFVIESYAEDAQAEITLLHAYAPLPRIEMDDKTVMARMAENLSYLRQKNNDTEEALNAARTRLLKAGFAAERVTCVFKPQQKDAAQEIIDLARQGRFTTVLLNRRPGSINRFFTASVSKKVVKTLTDIDVITVA